MVHKVGVLHLVKRVGLLLSLLVQHYLADLANNTSLKPLNRLFFLDKFMSFIFLDLPIDLIKVFSCELNLKLNAFYHNCSLLVYVLLFCELINVDFLLALVEHLSHDFIHQVRHVHLLELITVVHTCFFEARFDKERYHRQKESKVYDNFDH